MGDLHVMDNVCALLNEKQRTSKVLGWKYLGDSFGIRKEILDDLTPTQEELEGPTEVLIRYLGASKPFLNIADFIWALHVIERDDIFSLLHDYLPGRYPFQLQSRPETLKQFVQVSSPFPFSVLFLPPKCFTLVNIEWGSGVFQGNMAPFVSSGRKFFRMSSEC